MGVVGWCDGARSTSSSAPELEVLLIWSRVGQGPIELAIGAGGVVWTFFLWSIISLFFLPLSELVG